MTRRATAKSRARGIEGASRQKATRDARNIGGHETAKIEVAVKDQDDEDQGRSQGAKTKCGGPQAKTNKAIARRRKMKAKDPERKARRAPMATRSSTEAKTTIKCEDDQR